MGRFLQTDPVGYEADMNLYTYVNSDPLNLTDPTGECPWCIVGAVIGGGLELRSQLKKNGGDWSKVNYGAVAGNAAMGAVGGGGAGVVVKQLGKAALKKVGKNQVKQKLKSAQKNATQKLDGGKRIDSDGWTGGARTSGNKAEIGEAVSGGLHGAKVGSVSGGITGAFQGGMSAIENGEDLGGVAVSTIVGGSVGV